MILVLLASAVIEHYMGSPVYAVRERATSAYKIFLPLLLSASDPLRAARSPDPEVAERAARAWSRVVRLAAIPKFAQAHAILLGDDPAVTMDDATASAVARLCRLAGHDDFHWYVGDYGPYNAAQWNAQNLVTARTAYRGWIK